MPKKGTKCRKTPKICVVCGKVFEGTESAQSCSPSCRVRLVRLKAANKRPEFILMAKSKGQKIPDLNAPKRLKFKRGEKMKRELPLESEINFSVPTLKSYDGKKLDNITVDESAMFATPLTHEQIWAKIDELEKEKKEAKDEKMPPGMLVRRWALVRDSKVQDIQDGIDKLKKLIK